MKVLVINAGSSSVKYHLYQMPQAEVLANGMVERIAQETSTLIHFYRDRAYTLQAKVADVQQGVELILETLARAPASLVRAKVGTPAGPLPGRALAGARREPKDVGGLRSISEVGAVGHRVVHGGEEFTGSVIVDQRVIASIEKYADLAPLHNPPNLAGILAVQRKLPTVKQVACFDTAFHATIPQVAYMYALPYELYETYHIRRYGFHGISHRYVARRAAAIMNRGKYDINAITCHLGNGCSVTAIKQGRSVDTSMGFTPLEGVPMGTRSGDLDPAIFFYLAEKGYDAESLNLLANKRSGLLGISGTSNDVRVLVQLAGAGDARAQLAIDIFCYRVKKYIGAYAAVLGSFDALIFTGGIGENAVSLRQQICAAPEPGGAWIGGVRLDQAANQAAVAKEAEISATDSKVKVFVIPTNEQAAIAHDTYELARHQPRPLAEVPPPAGGG